VRPPRNHNSSVLLAKTLLSQTKQLTTFSSPNYILQQQNGNPVYLKKQHSFSYPCSAAENSFC
jgi:hypothetical protein